jgi:hypothetical protein
MEEVEVDVDVDMDVVVMVNVNVRGKHTYEQQAEPLHAPSDIPRAPLSITQAYDNVPLA